MRHFARGEEPYFELPPRLATSMERRLSANAAALWEERCAAGRWPRADCYGLDEPLPADFASHSLMIDLRQPDGPRIDSIGAALAMTFALGPGPLPRGPEGSLAHRLRGACATLRVQRAPVPIDAPLHTADGEARLLTRGILLPLADAQGALGFAHVVLTWKEVLGAAATAALCLELTATRNDTEPRPRIAFD